MAKSVVLLGVSVENVNVDPPLLVASNILGEELEETVKSDANPVVAPDVEDTLIAQYIVPPARCGFPAVQERAEEVVGIP